MTRTAPVNIVCDHASVAIKCVRYGPVRIEYDLCKLCVTLVNDLNVTVLLLETRIEASDNY